MSSSKTGAIAVDQARVELCRWLAKSLNGGLFHVRVRFPLVNGVPGEAWFYVHRDNTWHKETEIITDAPLVEALAEETDLLASKGHADEWSVRQNSAHDWKETDLQFHREPLADHLGKKLESYLMGLLFRDRHDSRQDRRQHLRNGPTPKTGSRP